MDRLPENFSVIGLDPGDSTGISKWDPFAERFIHFNTLTFWETIYYLSDHDPAYTLVLCENPKLNAPPMFNAPMPRTPAEAGTQRRRSQSVGMNKRDAQRYIEFLQRHSYFHQSKRPGKKKWIVNGKEIKGKVSMDQFTKITGWHIRLNEHERDAGLLIHGLSAARVLTMCKILAVDRLVS